MSRRTSGTELMVTDQKNQQKNEKPDFKTDGSEIRYRHSLTQLPVSIDDKVTIRVWNTNYCGLNPGHVSVELYGKNRAYISAWPADGLYYNCCGNSDEIDLETTCGAWQNWINGKVGYLRRHLGFPEPGELRTQRDEYKFPEYETLHNYHKVSKEEQKQIEKNIGQVVDLYSLNARKIYALYKKYRRYHFNTHHMHWFSMRSWERICHIEPFAENEEKKASTFLKEQEAKAKISEEHQINSHAYFKQDDFWVLYSWYYNEKGGRYELLEIEKEIPNLIPLLEVKDKIGKLDEKNRVNIYLTEEKSLGNNHGQKTEPLAIFLVKENSSTLSSFIPAYFSVDSHLVKFTLNLSSEELEFLAEQKLEKIVESKENSYFFKSIMTKSVFNLDTQISDMIRYFQIRLYIDYGLTLLYHKKNERGDTESFFAGRNADGSLLFGQLNQLPQLTYFNQKMLEIDDECERAKEQKQDISLIHKKYTMQLMQDLGFREINNVQFKWSLFAFSWNVANVSCTSLSKHLLVDGGLIDHLTYYDRPILHRLSRLFLYLIIVAIIFSAVFLRDYFDDLKINTLTKDLVIAIPCTFGAWVLTYLFETCCGTAYSETLTPLVTTPAGILELAKKAKKVERARWGEIDLPDEQKIEIRVDGLLEHKSSNYGGRLFNSKNTQDGLGKNEEHSFAI